MGVLLVPVLLVALLIVLVLPFWPWSRGWGYNPAGILAVTLGTILLFLWAELASR